MSAICKTCIHKDVCEYRVSDDYPNFTKCSDYIEERPQGKWINTQTLDYIGECSACCYISNKYYNFCPNCGADMRGDNNG